MTKLNLKILIIIIYLSLSLTLINTDLMVEMEDIERKDTKEQESTSISTTVQVAITILLIISGYFLYKYFMSGASVGNIIPATDINRSSQVIISDYKHAADLIFEMCATIGNAEYYMYWSDSLMNNLVGNLEREAHINLRDNTCMKTLIDTCNNMRLPVLERNAYLYIVKDSILFKTIIRTLVIYCYITWHRVYTGDVLNDYIFRNIPMEVDVLTREKIIELLSKVFET